MRTEISFGEGDQRAVSRYSHKIDERHAAGRIAGKYRRQLTAVLCRRSLGPERLEQSGQLVQIGGLCRSDFDVVDGFHSGCYGSQLDFLY